MSVTVSNLLYIAHSKRPSEAEYGRKSVAANDDPAADEPKL
jgi:hypothetical protein